MHILTKCVYTSATTLKPQDLGYFLRNTLQNVTFKQDDQSFHLSEVFMLLFLQVQFNPTFVRLLQLLYIRSQLLLAPIFRLLIRFMSGFMD